MNENNLLQLTAIITDFSKWDDTIHFCAVQFHMQYNTGISNFITEDYNLECCLDYDLQEGYFTLLFDEAPDFDGEPVEKPDAAENVYTYRKIA